MHKLFRILASTLAVAALAIGGSSTALAASPSGPANVERYEFDDAWCFDYGTSYDCTVVDGTLFVTATPDGREIARITFREVVTTFDPSGNEIGSSRTNAFDRTVFAEGGQDETFSVTHTRAVGDFGTCITTYLLRIVDFEVQLDRYAGPGCN